MARFIDLLASNHPCIYVPETTSFTAGHPCPERVRGRTFCTKAEAFNTPSSGFERSTPVAFAGSAKRGGSMVKGTNLRRRTVKKDLQVEYTESSSERLLGASTRKVEGRKGRGGVVELMRGAAKGFLQQIRVGRQHNQFL